MPLVSQGQWTVPPEQAMLGPSETSFSLHRVARDLTVVMSTSVGEFTPSTEPVLAVLESLQANVALRWCRKLLVFDRVPSWVELEALKRDRRSFLEDLRGPKWERLWNEKREAYEEYCETMKAMREAGHPALFNTQLLFRKTFGHLFGTVRQAFDTLDTPFAFVTQHDLRLGPRVAAADVQQILEALDSGLARYVVLNRDVNSGSRTQLYFRMLPERSLRETKRPRCELTAVAGFSDQAHFTVAAWYRREVLEAIPLPRQLTCMEHMLHERWKESQDWRGTFLYGGLDDGPFVYDLVHGVQVHGPTGRVLGLTPMPARVAPA